MTIRTERHRDVLVVTIHRPEVRNAVDRHTADQLTAAFRAFDADPSARVAVLHGSGDVFCSGADLREVAEGGGHANRVDALGDGPMGPTRLLLGKPVIAAVEGHAVAGGLELALWCDLRVAAEDAVLGVFCRRWGVPLIDGGTVRLPRIVGHGNAMDLILTGRGVHGEEALRMGLVTRLVGRGEALAAALELAHELAALPQDCLRSDRMSACEQWDLPMAAALRGEAVRGEHVLRDGGAQAGAARFRDGAGRHGLGG
jgi:enoyl-CoA hydratase